MIQVYGPMERRSTSQVDENRVLLYYQELPKADPFILLSEDRFSSVGFDWHPHRGFETVTYVVDGELEHIDNAGGFGILKPGDLQWVTTGRGVMHAELAHDRKFAHTLQLWLNLPQDLRMVQPRYQDLRGNEVPTVEGDRSVARVYSGLVRGVQGPASNYWATTVVDVRFESGGSFVYDVPVSDTLGVYAISGDLTIDGQSVRKGQIAWRFAGESSSPPVEMKARAQSHVIAYSSKPIGQPFVQYGPMVMNTEAEIRQAFADLQRGAFGPLPKGT